MIEGVQFGCKPRGAQKGARKGDKIEGKGETRSGSAQGTKMEPKRSQNADQREIRFQVELRWLLDPILADQK